MPKRSSNKRFPDPNTLAFSIVQATTDEPPAEQPAQLPAQGKNPHAVALGRLGGTKGGKARAAKLSAKKRRAIATRAAAARWKKS